MHKKNDKMRKRDTYMAPATEVARKKRILHCRGHREREGVMIQHKERKRKNIMKMKCDTAISLYYFLLTGQRDHHHVFSVCEGKRDVRDK